MNEKDSKSYHIPEFYKEPEFDRDFPILHSVDFDRLISAEAWPVGVSSRYPARLREKITAAVVSERLGNSSVDYTLKRYVEPLDDGSRKPLADDLVDAIYYETQKIAILFRNIDNTYCDGAGHVIAGVNLSRIANSIFSPVSAANRGFFLEPCAIVRIYLEQIAWSVRARWERRETDGLLNWTAEKAISELKRYYSTAGRFYQLLSEICHHHPDHHLFFRGKQKEGEKIRIIVKSNEFRRISLCFILLLVDIFGIMTEALYEDHITDFSFWGKGGNINANRRTKKMLLIVKERYPQDAYVGRIVALLL